MHRDDPVAIRCAEPLLPEKHPKVESILTPFEFRGKRIGHRVVNIQDDFSPKQSGDDGTEHQEIRHVVNMNSAVVPLDEKTGGLHETPEKELYILKEVSETPAAPIPGLIQPDHTHTTNHLRRRGTSPAQCQKVHLKSSVNSRFGLPDDARIRLIIG